MTTVMMRCMQCAHSSGGCTGSCRQWPYTNTQLPAFPYGAAEVVPKGCICPPGSDKTCQRSDCGRKDYRVSTTTATLSQPSDT